MSNIENLNKQIDRLIKEEENKREQIKNERIQRDITCLNLVKGFTNIILPSNKIQDIYVDSWFSRKNIMCSLTPDIKDFIEDHNKKSHPIKFINSENDVYFDKILIIHDLKNRQIKYKLYDSTLFYSYD